MKVIDRIQDGEKPGLFKQAFSGGVLVNVVRLPTFVFVAILLIALIVWPMSVISDYLANRRRVALVAQYKEHKGKHLSEFETELIRKYLNAELNPMYFADYKRHLAYEKTVFYGDSLTEETPVRGKLPEEYIPLVWNSVFKKLDLSNKNNKKDFEAFVEFVKNSEHGLNRQGK